MRSRRPPDHQEAVARRLALLSAELAQEAPPPPPDPSEPDLSGPDPSGPDPYAMVESHTRVAGRPPDPEPAPPPVPLPGRHAARRALGAAVPETLRGRVALGPGQVAVVAVLVALGLAASAWWVVRAEPHDVVAAPVAARPAPALASGAPVAPAGHGAAVPSATPSGEVTVDVAGKVRRPGIVVLPAGSRVVDALEAAGGARPGVDLTSLNLARLLVDGEQVLVGLPPPVGAVGSVGTVPSTGAATGALVNLNTATEAELETLPDVGPVTAEAILAWRTEHGGFSSVDELLEVDGIGDATLATIAPHVTV